MPKNARDKANLEMTEDDHLAIGSTPPVELRRNPGKTLAETMDDTRLRSFIVGEVEATKEAFDRAKAGDERQKELTELLRDGFLSPNVAYLREIGRLPAELADLDPATRFAL